METISTSQIVDKKTKSFDEVKVVFLGLLFYYTVFFINKLVLYLGTKPGEFEKILSSSKPAYFLAIFSVGLAVLRLGSMPFWKNILQSVSTLCLGTAVISYGMYIIG